MVNRNESEMLQGQITIFDFPEWLPGEKTRNKIVPEECKQCVDIGKIYDVNGEFEIDIYHCGIDGHPTKTESGKPGTKCIKNHVCKFSNHTCNKEELWKVAQSFDDIECKKYAADNVLSECVVQGAMAQKNRNKKY